MDHCQDAVRYGLIGDVDFIEMTAGMNIAGQRNAYAELRAVIADKPRRRG
ncbi:MAG: hypothetical protein P4L46_22980 [Fimbriimonas sp.]|nr:hypothetical protein [Fimbriimonas sp.]